MTPAGLALLSAGITGRSLASDLGVTPSAVSFQLAGRAAELSPDLLEAIVVRGGIGLAQRVALLVGFSKAERRDR